MSKTLRTAGLASAGLAVVFASYLGLLVRPGVLFAHELKHGSFRVHSEQPLGGGIVAILDDMDEALATSTLYDRSQKHDILFAHDDSVYRAVQDANWKLSSAVTGLGQSLTYNESAAPYFSHIITYRIPDIENDALLHPLHRHAVNMTRTLTHEVVHSLLQARFGNDLFHYPMWKQEGYAEYVAASTSILAAAQYDFRDSLERISPHDLSTLRDAQGRYRPLRYGGRPRSFTVNEAGFARPTSYYIARVLMEYALDVKGMSLEQVMSPETTDTAMLAEMISATNPEGVEAGRGLGQAEVARGH